MTFSRDDPRPQLNVRIDVGLMERIEARCRALGTSKSKLVRTALYEHLPDDGGLTPPDPALRDVYVWLRESADDRNGIPVDLALTELAQQLGMSKDLVKRNRLKPLDRENWIDVDFGEITVLDPETKHEEEAS